MTATQSVTGARVRPHVARRATANVLYAVGLPILILVAWSVAASVSPSRYFPSPARIADAFVKTWVGEAFFVDVVPSLGRLAIGLALSIVLGIVIGTVIGLDRTLRDLLEPLLEFFRAVPPPVLIPIFTIMLGVSDQMRIVVIVSGAIWPVLLNTIDGVRSVDSTMTETARAFELTPIERTVYLVLPSAGPRIMAGVRQSLAVGLILMVISEMFVASSGLGYRLVYFQRNFLIAEMWSGIVLLGLIGVALALLFGVVERCVLRWYRGQKEAERG